MRNYTQTANTAHLRTRDQITEFFGDFELVPPGLVWTPQWGDTIQDQWSGPPDRSRYLAGVARKPEASQHGQAPRPAGNPCTG